MKPFLDSLSSFWNRLFADSAQISALYDATYAALGQAYLDLMETVLSKALVDAPVFHKEYWKYLYILNTDCGDASSITPGFSYGFLVSAQLGGINTLANSVVTPGVLLEREIDFSGLFNYADGGGRGLISAVAFLQDPFKSGTGGGPLDGFACADTGRVNVVVNEGPDGEASGTNFLVLNRTPFDVFSVGRKLYVYGASPTPTVATITTIVSSNEVIVDTSLGTDTGLRWEIVEPIEKALSFWAADAEIDTDILYANFGKFVNQKRVSTEGYKELLQGIYQYYTGGPLAQNVEAVVNVMHGYPLVDTEGEILTAYVPDAGGGYDQVITDKNDYLIPSTATRDDIKLPGSIGTLTFSAFEPLSDKIYVRDYTIDPKWWWNISLPPAVGGNDESSTRLLVSPQMYVPVVGGGDYPAKIGDLGLTVGTSPVLRHSYAVTDTYLKHHLFGVFAQNSETRISFSDMLDVLFAGRLVGSYPTLVASQEISEGVSVAETLDVTVI